MQTAEPRTELDQILSELEQTLSLTSDDISSFSTELTNIRNERPDATEGDETDRPSGSSNLNERLLRILDHANHNRNRLNVLRDEVTLY